MGFSVSLLSQKFVLCCVLLLFKFGLIETISEMYVGTEWFATALSIDRSSASVSSVADMHEYI